MEEEKIDEEKKSMKVDEKEKFSLSWVHWILIGIIVALGIYAAIFFTRNQGLSASQRATLAQDLSDRNITLYTTSTCPHCKDQKALFGAEIRYLRVVTCDVQPDEFCGSLSAVPAWKLPDGEVILGVLTYSNLQDLIVACTPAGCNLQGSFTKVNISE